MPIDHFSKGDFEAALPKHKDTGKQLWRYAGLDKGEHCYFLNWGNKLAEIFIRSSVRADGASADVGQDSIRCWLCEPSNTRPLAKKLSTYITRVPGWRDRLINQLRRLVTLGNSIRQCPTCQATLRVVEIKRGVHKGGLALTCPTKENGQYANHLFEFINDRTLEVVKGKKQS